MPPEVATDFDVITIGRSIRDGSPPGGRRASDDGSLDEEPTVDVVDAYVNAPASSSVGGAPGANESAPTNRVVDNTLGADAPTDDDAGSALGAGAGPTTNCATDVTVSADVAAPTNNDVLHPGAGNDTLITGTDVPESGTADDAINAGVGTPSSGGNG